MIGFLLDTNVLSELERPRPSPNVRTFLRRSPLDSLYLSAVILAEIRFGIEHTANADRRDKLTRWLRDVIRPMFAGRILPMTEDIFLRWRWIVETSRRKGTTLDQVDSLLAAIAQHHDLVVVTRDVEPFVQAEVHHFNPWLAR
ncbi:MAG: type II toxin-antitoxin system VapC family toxin [Hyphomicrobiales bacterium]|nr:type II toxin-antitoxin system VapC family toxin [Hyphomicrobiales bacterium]